ncbi:peptide deformylase [Bacillus badius]|uniref:peptide deformylase n=1 Tax=Bacillus badius TaxID=1455 RepID=UPI0007B06DF9|nr:peptide deformylase [Bacillus badius]KZO01527.1 peptide deformylase [Bacillus badius]MED0667169.1 peptide deformylase [Bacillus badius]OCS89922.1 peptide deformylase [Bacillus badius]OVE53448.1 peptide deformylase [Bacillus badius]TDW05805.1 peptide deformylase [Bacillus badius]
MITMKDIVREGHPVLREKAADVTLPLSEEDKKTAKNLLEYVQNSQDPEIAQKFGLRPGVGLAAPQIGLSKRIIAIQVHDEHGDLISHALINPKIMSHSVEKAYLVSGEGCLSVDRDVPGYVHRYARVTIKALDADGNELKLRLKGLPAIVAQHEIDHLNGVMFYDHIDPQNPFTVPEGSSPIER